MSHTRELLQIANEVLLEVCVSATPLNKAISRNNRLGHLNSRKRGFVTGLCYTTCRLWNVLLTDKMAGLSHADRIKGLLLRTWGLHPELSTRLDIKAPPKPPRPEVDAIGIPEFWKPYVSRAIPQPALTLAGGFFETAPTDLCSDSPESVLAHLDDRFDDIKTLPELPFALSTRFNIPRNIFSELEKDNHRLWPMDRGSQLIVKALAVQPEHAVLDLCAGGAGKSRLIQLHRPKSLMACDLEERRLKDIPTRLSDPDVTTEKYIGDSSQVDFKRTFERVLVDVPCSGSGTIRRHPDLMLRLIPEQLDQHSQTQRALLKNGLKHLAPGGRLVYSTCSIFAHENEEIVSSVLADLDDGSLVSDASAYLLPSIQGSDGFYWHAIERLT